METSLLKLNVARSLTLSRSFNVCVSVQGCHCVAPVGLDLCVDQVDFEIIELCLFLPHEMLELNKCLPATPHFTQLKCLY